MKKHKVKVDFMINNKKVYTELTLDKVFERIKLKSNYKLCYDFIGSISTALDIEFNKSKMEQFGVTKYVPMRVLHSLYDPILIYIAKKYDKLPTPFSYCATERILLKCLCNIPEIIINHRFFKGITNNEGEFQLFDKNKNEIKIEVQDPYDRFYSLYNLKTQDNIKKKHYLDNISLKGRNKMKISDNNGKLLFQTYIKKLNKIIRNPKDPVYSFLYRAHRYLRIPETHAGRRSDNLLFEIDEIVYNIIISVNYLFNNQLNHPFNKVERKPFTIPLYRLSNKEKLPNNKVLLGIESLEIPSQISKELFLNC